MTTTSFETSHTTEPLNDTLTIPLDTYAGRIAARAYAYALLAEGLREEGEAILNRVGREDT